MNPVRPRLDWMTRYLKMKTMGICRFTIVATTLKEGLTG